MQLAQPLELEMRDPFLRAVAIELGHHHGNLAAVNPPTIENFGQVHLEACLDEHRLGERCDEELPLDCLCGAENQAGPDRVRLERIGSQGASLALAVAACRASMPRPLGTSACCCLGLAVACACASLRSSAATRRRNATFSCRNPVLS